MQQTTQELAEKAKLRQVPEISISKRGRIASINVYQNRISVPESLLSLWREGKFNEDDVAATLAHEIAHLMDLRHGSSSSSFRNLLVESLWLSFGIVPLVLFMFSPSGFILGASILLAAGWGFSVPLVVRRVEVGVELEADRKAATYLVKPKQLADALVKIHSFGALQKKVGLGARLSFFAGTITHPTFSERVRSLQSL